MEVGNTFTITTYNTRTITSGNATAVEVWKISDINGDTITCELLSTDKMMYSGGYHKTFSAQQVTKYLNK